MSVRFAEKAVTFLFDLFAVNIAFFTAYWIRFSSGLFAHETGAAPATFTYLEPSFILLPSE